MPEIITRRAPLAASSWDEEARTLEVIFSTGAPVERLDARGAYVERLDLSQDWTPFIGAPVLNSHRRGDLSDVLGHVVKAWTVSPTEARAVIKLSRRPDVEAVVQDIRDGHLRGVSVGYTVAEWSESTTGGKRVKTATRWAPVELSVVPIAADPGATIRGESMPPEVTTETPPAPAARAAVNSEIRSIARVAGLDQSWIDAQVDAGATADAARTAAFEAMQARAAPAAAVRSAQAPTLDDPATRASAMADAIVTRVNPAHEPSGPARAYVGLSLPELARESLRSAGISTTGLSAATVVTRALHTTSDFSLALGDAVGRVLGTAYRAAPSGLKPLARQVNLADFRARTFIRLSGLSDLSPVNEHGEFKRGTMEESGESVKLATFGKVFGITRQAIVNDDLGAFSDIPRKLGEAAARLEADKLAALVESNPAMSDTKTLFHADHANIGAGDVNVDNVGVGRLAMRQQKDKAGFRIAVAPKFLVVSAENETDAEKFLAEISPAKVGDVQPIKLALVVEPRLSMLPWYLVDPAVDGLVTAYLAGEPGPQVESRAGFDVDGVETKVRLDFGCAFTDWRGWYKSSGV